MTRTAMARRLVQAAQEGDVQAREDLVRMHRGLIVYCAKRFYRPGAFTELEDLVQQGCLGLLRALEKFDLKRTREGEPVPFATYARYWIEMTIRREIQKRSRMMASPLELFWSEEGEWKERDLRVTGAREGPEETYALRHDRNRLSRWLAELTEKQRYVIEWHYGLRPGEGPKTLNQIAAELHISPKGAGQLQQRAVQRLRVLARASGEVSPATPPPERSPRWVTIGTIAFV